MNLLLLVLTLQIFLHVKSFWLFEAPYFMQLDNTHYTNFPVTTVNMTFDFIDNIYILENISLTNGCHELYQTDYRVNYTEGNNANIIIDGGCSLQKKVRLYQIEFMCDFNDMIVTCSTTKFWNPPFT
ncbi:hypothetical protein A3Q56_04474 [Intoshia linei]|uniref:Uncharacterized protein n=1 Tax=Intoshia linei TaxID=1819745 RepID=A0A177B2X4_9BILA|nr:hypothetical protein A3Q56_04474 [Intoshia linei]